MTRKQALLRAIAALSDDPAEGEAVETLKKMVADLPLTHWTDSAVRDSVEQFIEDHGHLPIPSDFKTGGLPPTTAFHRLYHTTVGQWLAQNFTIEKPDYSELIAKQMAQETELFVHEYYRIKPRSREEYDRQRCAAAKSAQTIINYNQASSWTSLRTLLELPVFPKNRDTHKVKLTVDLHHDFHPEDDIYDNLL